MGCFGGVLSCLKHYWGLLGFSYYDKMLGVAAGSGRDGVASGRGVEADGAPVGGAPAVAVGREDGSGRDGLRTGSRRCSDGPAS